MSERYKTKLVSELGSLFTQRVSIKKKHFSTFEQHASYAVRNRWFKSCWRPYFLSHARNMYS